ncbi:hypothetical protein [Streptomyces sp. LaBMicrA B280]|uniref:hypothetical protein n=1 Tax=Streptomyces sp. LaBMicrA B280 TaxID=3391001 RepID=UPI003BA43209
MTMSGPPQAGGGSWVMVPDTVFPLRRAALWPRDFPTSGEPVGGFHMNGMNDGMNGDMNDAMKADRNRPYASRKRNRP